MYLLRGEKVKDNHNRKGREFYSAPSSVELKKWEK
jgi:hypothetical protein